MPSFAFAPSAALFAAVAVLAGLGQAASIAAPWSGQPQWWLQIASLAVLAGLLRRSRSRWQAAGTAWAFAIAWLAGTWWWLYISMHVYGGLAAPLAAVAVLALATFLGTYYALAGAMLRGAAPRSALAWTLMFASAWLLAELLRGTLFTGFPWGAGGYAHVDGPLSSLAPLVGVYGIGFVAAAVAAMLALLVEPAVLRTRAFIATAGVVIASIAAAIVIGPGLTRGSSTAGATFTVSLLQGNIPQDEKFEAGTGVPLALNWYGRQLASSTSTLVVTPETAVPMLPSQLPQGYHDALVQRFSAARGQAALVGIPLGSYTEGYSNSVQGFAPGQRVYRYDKHHLVPFGEFIPPLFKWFVRLMNIPLGDFNRGAPVQPPLAFAGQRFAPNICYEDLFGEELGAHFADPARAPTVFVNLSNIAWFGDSLAIDQHLQISRMRAIEFDRPMLRATNTGATAIIEPTGRVARMLPRHTRGVLTGEVRGRESITPFAWWVSRAGLLPLWLLGLVAPIMVMLQRRRTRP